MAEIQGESQQQVCWGYLWCLQSQVLKGSELSCVMWGSDLWGFMSRGCGRPVIWSEAKLGRTPGKISTKITIMDHLEAVILCVDPVLNLNRRNLNKIIGINSSL